MLGTVEWSRMLGPRDDSDNAMTRPRWETFGDLAVLAVFVAIGILLTTVIR